MSAASLVSSDLALSRVPQATTLPPDPSLVMHWCTYAICSWIIKETYARVSLWAPSRVTLLIQLREHHKYTHLERRWNVESTLWSPPQGITKCKCSSDRIQSRHNTKCTMQAQNITSKEHRQDMQALIHTFLRDTGIPGIVSLLRRLIAHCVAALGPPQDTERPVQPPEGPTPHWWTVKVSDCKGNKEEREAIYRLAHRRHARTCLNLPPHSQSNAFSRLSVWDLCWFVTGEKIKHQHDPEVPC